MASSVAGAERDLRKLQSALRRRPKAASDPSGGLNATVVRTGRRGPINLSAAEVQRFQDVVLALLADQRFEHLGRKAKDAAWGFVHDCIQDKRADHIPAFVTEHAKEPVALVCYLPIEFLSVGVETVAFGLRLLAVDDPRLPASNLAFPLDRPVGCAAAVDVWGTSHQSMANRAKASASQALRLLRVALNKHAGINDWQLRFRLAEAHAFSDGASGWSARADSAFELGLSDELVALALSQPVAALTGTPSNDIERRADLATRWLERAAFASEPIEALLYLFFALEALLGDTSEERKGEALAFRQAMLSHAVNQGFTHPSRTYFLYDKVRSAAVHGEDLPDVTWDVAREFGSAVRKTLDDYLTYASERGFGRRSQLVKAIREHPDQPKLIAWLRAQGGEAWGQFLAELEGASQREEATL